MAHCDLGTLQQEMGDFEPAHISFREALRQDPRHAGARAALATLLRGQLPEGDMEAMKQLLADPLLNEGKRASLHYGLAQVLDARAKYADSAEHLRLANSYERDWRQKRGQGYDPGDHTRFVNRLIATFTPAFFDAVRGWGSESVRPVFIFGLPRSGTTLVEQILASHLQVHGAGELRLARDGFDALASARIQIASTYDERAFEAVAGLDRVMVQILAERHLAKLHAMSPSAARVTDKTPDNYLYLGLLATLFPRATFIHCRRDLRDVAVSCWMTAFRHINWANDFEHIGARFQDYQRLMAHWDRTLPVSLMQVDYEQIVGDLERVARQLVHACGVEWQPACLAFHQTPRPVRTASVTQVRQPIYGGSVARWKHYEPALKPLFRRLQAD